MLGDVLREIASESGFEVDEDNTYVIDHHSFDTAKDDGYHTRHGLVIQVIVIYIIFLNTTE